jgi:hypothetical protein
LSLTSSGWFENQASETGLFGGIVNGSVNADFMSTINSNLREM